MFSTELISEVGSGTDWNEVGEIRIYLFSRNPWGFGDNDHGTDTSRKSISKVHDWISIWGKEDQSHCNGLQCPLICSLYRCLHGIQSSNLKSWNCATSHGSWPVSLLHSMAIPIFRLSISGHCSVLLFVFLYPSNPGARQPGYAGLVHSEDMAQKSKPPLFNL